MITNVEGEVEIAQQLERIDPSLEVAVFAPEQCRVRSNCVKKLPILRVSRQDQTALRSLAIVELRLGKHRGSKPAHTENQDRDLQHEVRVSWRHWAPFIGTCQLRCRGFQPGVELRG